MIWTLTTIVLTILAIFLILKFVKKLVFTIISMVVLFLVIISIFSVLAYLDFKDLKTNLNQNTSVMILSDNSNYITGGYFTPSKPSSENKPIMNIQELSSKSYKEILGSNYKLIIVDISFLDTNLPEIINHNGKQISKSNLFNILRSSTPKTEFASVFNIQESSISYNNEELRYQLFLSSIDNLMEKGGLTVLIEGYEDDKIIIYPETIAFKIIKLLPSNYQNKYITN